MATRSVHPQTEDYRGNVNPIGPRACYDEGKRCAETLFFDYHRQHKLRIRVARIFNTYGPRMHPNDGRVVSNFIVQALKGEPITLYGDGTQTRAFCYVDDLIEGFVRLMAAPDDVTGPINLGNPVETTVARTGRSMIIELTGSRSKIVHRPLPVDDPIAALPRHRARPRCSAGSRRCRSRPASRRRSPISTACSPSAAKSSPPSRQARNARLRRASPRAGLRRRAPWPRRARFRLARGQRSTSKSSISSWNSRCQLISALRCMNTEPRPIAARSMNTNSRGGLHAAEAAQLAMHLLGDVAAVDAGLGLLDAARAVLQQRRIDESAPSGSARRSVSRVSFLKPQLS